MVINSVIIIIILYLIFSLLRNKYDKIRLFRVLGLIVFCVMVLIINSALSRFTVGVMWNTNDYTWLYCVFGYFFVVLSIFYFWYKKGKRLIIDCAIFWVLSIVCTYLLFKGYCHIFTYYYYKLGM
jgi:peptidoglycan/LPS O-acetylase OafA/YrhL